MTSRGGRFDDTQTNHLSVENSSDCAPAREHPKMKKSARPMNFS
jgi:hypothetical protein